MINHLCHMGGRYLVTVIPWRMEMYWEIWLSVSPIWQCFGVSPYDWLYMWRVLASVGGWLGSQVGYQGILDLGRVCEWRVWDQLARELPYGLNTLETDAWSSHPLHAHANIIMVWESAEDCRPPQPSDYEVPAQKHLVAETLHCLP